MTPDPIRISADKNLPHLNSLMRAYHVRRAPIVDGFDTRGEWNMTDIFAALREEHQALLPPIEELRVIADRLDEMPQYAVRQSLDGVYQFLTNKLKRHAAAEEGALYPVVGRILGSLQATATMTRDHVEVSRITEQLGWLLSQTSTAFDLEQMKNVRRMLYGLYTLLKVHFAKEEEIYLPLLESQLSGGAANRLLHKMAQLTLGEHGLR